MIFSGGSSVGERDLIVDDFGVTLNPLLLAGQVHGGAMQGIGQALMEHAVYSSNDGQLVTGTFMDYALPRASDGPSFVFETHNVPCTTNPLGVKGAGEAGAIGSCPAVVNAIIEGFSGVTFGIHLCRGGKPGAHRRSGSYEMIAEQMFNTLRHHRFLLEYDTERAGGFEPLRFVPKGKIVVLGLLSTKEGKLELEDHLKRRIDEASK